MEHPGSLLLLADVVLPLPLAETYTYRLPERLQDRVAVGSRLIVPFGSKKIYSAIVVKVYSENEMQLRCYETSLRDYENLTASQPHNLTTSQPHNLKEALDVLDASPVLLPDQLWLWHWISDYYICTLGEVYKAALPSGMKLESESLVEYNPDYDSSEPLSPVEQYAFDLMERLHQQKIVDLQKSIQEYETSLSPKTQRSASPSKSLRVIKSLFDKGALIMHEQLQRNYRPKTIHCVRLSEAYFSEERQKQLFEELRRAPKQATLLTRYLDLSKASAALTLQNHSLLIELEKSMLMEGQSEAAFKGLRERGVLDVYEKQVSRIGEKSTEGQGSKFFARGKN